MKEGFDYFIVWKENRIRAYYCRCPSPHSIDLGWFFAAFALFVWLGVFIQRNGRYFPLIAIHCIMFEDMIILWMQS